MPYLGKQSEQVGVSVQKYEFLQGTDSSSGATSFSIPSDSGDHVNVWLNGILLVEGATKDYTTTNSTVDFVTAPADDDIVRIDVIESFALPDALKSSGDAMSGALKLNGGIQQQTSADLSGTYAYHQLMLSDAFTVAGDVTISDNLVLAKLSDDSNAITISNDTSTRTITGTGSLEASTLAQTPNQSLTGMTGEIGSAVTGTIGSGVTGGSALDGSQSGTGAFLAAGNAASWTGLSAGEICPFAMDSPTSTQDVFDTDNNYNTSTYKYTCPATGVYFFWFSVYTQQSDTTNAFGFETNEGLFENTFNTGENRVTYNEHSTDHIQNGCAIMQRNSGDTVWVNAAIASDFYKGRSSFGGCRLR